MYILEIVDDIAVILVYCRDEPWVLVRLLVKTPCLAAAAPRAG